MIALMILVCWAIGLLIWQLNRYMFKHPTSRLIPSCLRHTWFAGLSIIIATFIFCLPGLFTVFWPFAILVFAMLLVAFRKKGIELMISDLRLHKRDGRGLFEHSKDCYMVGGRTATFMKKILEERKILNPFE